MLQINELYEEVLHEILHSIGAEKNSVNQRNIMAFAQEAFKVEQATHESIYRAVLDKEVSGLFFNIAARGRGNRKNLRGLGFPKDELSGPECRGSRGGLLDKPSLQRQDEISPARFSSNPTHNIS